MSKPIPTETANITTPRTSRMFLLGGRRPSIVSRPPLSTVIFCQHNPHRALYRSQKMPEHFEKTKFQQKRRLKQTLKTNLRKLKTNLKNKHRVATAASAQPSAGSNASEDGECGDGDCGDGRVCKRATRPSSLRTNSSSILSLHRRASETLPAFQTSCPRPRRDQPASRTHSPASV